MWISHKGFSVPAGTIKAISQNFLKITVPKLHDITRKLSSLEFPVLVKLTFHFTQPDHNDITAADPLKFLKRSPLLEDLDLRLRVCPGVSRPAKAAELVRLKSVAFTGYLSHKTNSIHTNGLPCMILPKRSITIDLRADHFACSSDKSLLSSLIQLGDTIFPQ